MDWFANKKKRWTGSCKVPATGLWPPPAAVIINQNTKDEPNPTRVREFQNGMVRGQPPNSRRYAQHRARTRITVFLLHSCQMPNKQIQHEHPTRQRDRTGRGRVQSSKSMSSAAAPPHRHTLYARPLRALLLVWCVLRCNRVPLLLLVLHQEKPFCPMLRRRYGNTAHRVPDRVDGVV